MVNIPALGTGFTGIGFRNIDHGYLFLLRLKLQKLFEPIVLFKISRDGGVFSKATDLLFVK